MGTQRLHWRPAFDLLPMPSLQACPPLRMGLLLGRERNAASAFLPSIPVAVRGPEAGKTPSRTKLRLSFSPCQSLTGSRQTTGLGAHAPGKGWRSEERQRTNAGGFA